jgi:NRAMP (natural resistance-associated macrophage protein)-like metal ion transporter
MITANAGNDAGGIATFASVGAEFGYSLLWVLIPIAISLGIVQEMCARMGAVTGKGLADLVRERFGVRWTALIMLALLIANAGVTVSEFVGIAAAAELFGISRFISVPLAAILVWWLVAKGSYKKVEKVFLAMSVVFLGYIVSAFLSKPDWTAVTLGLVKPSLRLEHAFIFTLVAVIGTTISPYMQVYVQSSVVEKGVTTDNYRETKTDVWIGTVFAILIVFFIVVSTAATLHKTGIQITSAEDAARALRPLDGRYAETLFGIGLFGATMLEEAVVPLATAYSVCESFGFERGVSYSFKDAPIFQGLFTGMIILGAVVALIPGLPLIPLIVVAQIINGMLLPILLVFILRLVNDRRIMGKYVNSALQNTIAWGITGVLTVLSFIMILSIVLPAVGIPFLQ